MNKSKQGMILSALIIIISAILLANDYISADQNLPIYALLLHSGMMLYGCFSFYRHLTARKK
ncbi:MAG TPA: hypothetical protein DHV36_16345 [Desulfobacteraceae bacterium]|nr:hypothetical protein [Desulfobacteraceae bacterium]